VTRARTWSSNRSLEWARHFGALPPKRMIASWSGPDTGTTEYKYAAQELAPNGRLPSVRFVISRPYAIGQPRQTSELLSWIAQKRILPLK
jgi:hypothetical protein